MTLAARSKYNDALEMYCNNDPNDCGDAAGLGLQRTHEARSTANKATVVFLLDTAMVGGGGVSGASRDDEWRGPRARRPP